MLTRVLLALILLAVADTSRATRLAGDAAALRVDALASTDDGGWIASGALGRSPGRGDGFILRADAVDAAVWALRVPLTPLSAVAALPDGGALTGGADGLVARVDGSGLVAWQARIGAGDIEVRAISCDGWDCVVVGHARDAAFIVRVEASTGVATSELAAPFTATEMRPTAVLLLPGGGVLLGCTLETDEMARASVARLDVSGATLWAWVVSPPAWTQSPDAYADNAIRALAAWPDGRAAAVAENPWVEPLGLAMDATGVPDSALSSPLGHPRSLAVLPDGSVLLSGRAGTIGQHDARLAAIDSVRIGQVPEWAGDTRLALAATGDIVIICGARVARLRPTLSGIVSGCASLAPSTLLTGLAGAPSATADTVEFPARDVLGWALVPATLVAACTSTPCLAACEVDCSNGIDDDGDGRADCGDFACAFDAACALADADGDGILNQDDCRPADAATASAPASLLNMRMRYWRIGNMPSVHWADATTPVDLMSPVADVLRGELADLRSARSTAGGACVARRVNGWGWYDVDARAMASNLWYLVRPWNACGPGPWDETALDAGGGGCP